MNFQENLFRSILLVDYTALRSHMHFLVPFFQYILQLVSPMQVSYMSLLLLQFIGRSILCSNW